MICKKCGHNVDKHTVISCHDGMYCPCGEKLFKNYRRAYRLKLKIEELERRLKILT